MKITITIMAHPRRTEQANALYKKLVQYPFEKCSITWDEQNSEWHTGQRALMDHKGGDWHVVLQDDAIINEHFFTNLVKAIENVPDRVLFSLYTGTVRPFNDRVGAAVANAGNASWLKGYTLFWGVGIVIPTNHIEPMLEFVKDEHQDPYDTRIGMFYFRNMLPVFYTNPSLVDHDDDIGTIVGTRSSLPQGRRVARNMIDRDHEWNSDFVEI